MNRLEFFENYGLTGAKIGIISITQLMKYDLYKTYLEFRAVLNQEEARKATIQKHQCGYYMLARAIYWFEGKDETYKYKRGLQKSAKAVNS